MPELLLGLDVGSTGVRALLVDASGRFHGKATAIGCGLATREELVLLTGRPHWARAGRCREGPQPAA